MAVSDAEALPDYGVFVAFLFVSLLAVGTVLTVAVALAVLVGPGF